MQDVSAKERKKEIPCRIGEAEDIIAPVIFILVFHSMSMLMYATTCPF